MQQNASVNQLADTEEQHQNDGDNSNHVVKTGLVKVRRYDQRRAKKRWLVLRCTRPPLLEMYDSERRWCAGEPAKLCVPLSQLFGVSELVDAKSSTGAVGLMGPVSYSLLTESAGQQADWLDKLRRLLPGQTASVQYERMWDVQVTERGLGSSRRVAGIYCVGVTGDSIRLIGRDEQRTQIDLAFVTVRGCRHFDRFFCVQLGRSSALGAGELSMQLEEPIYAQNMHEVIKGKFKRRTTTPDSVVASSGSNTASPTVAVQPEPAPIGGSKSVEAATDSRCDQQLHEQQQSRCRSESVPSRRYVAGGSGAAGWAGWRRGGGGDAGGSEPSCTVSQSSLAAAVDEAIVCGSAPTGHATFMPARGHSMQTSSGVFAAGSSRDNSDDCIDAGDYLKMYPLLASPSTNTTQTDGALRPQSCESYGYMSMDGPASPAGRDLTTEGYVFMGAACAKSISPPPPPPCDASPTTAIANMSLDQTPPAAALCVSPASVPISIARGQCQRPRTSGAGDETVARTDTTSPRSRAHSLGSRLGMASYALLRRRDKKVVGGGDTSTPPPAPAPAASRLSSSWESPFTSLLASARRRVKQHSTPVSQPPPPPPVGSQYTRPRSFSLSTRRWLSTHQAAAAAAVTETDALRPVSAAPLQPIWSARTAAAVGADYDDDYLNMTAPAAVVVSPASSILTSDSGDYLNMSAVSPDGCVGELVCAGTAPLPTVCETDAARVDCRLACAQPAVVAAAADSDDDDTASGNYLEMDGVGYAARQEEQQQQSATDGCVDGKSDLPPSSSRPSNAAVAPLVDVEDKQPVEYVTLDLPCAPAGDTCDQTSTAGAADDVSVKKRDGESTSYAKIDFGTVCTTDNQV